MLTQTSGKLGGGENVKQLKGARRRNKPGWADGLRKLYDSVVDEPLPDSFEDLLKKLDQANRN